MAELKAQAKEMGLWNLFLPIDTDKDRKVSGLRCGGGQRTEWATHSTLA